MSNLIFCGVLLGAFLHASWNALLKSSTDKVLEIVLVTTAAGAICASLLPFVAAPARASWPYLLTSTVIECFYYRLLTAAYRSGEMSLVYPLMRGTAPALVALFGIVVLNETLSVHGWLAIGAICAGVLCLVFGAGVQLGGHRRAIPLALANSAVIASYTLIDGMGVRKSGSAVAYTLWMYVLLALPLLAWALCSARTQLVSYARRRAGYAGLGGAASIGSYGLALIAMTHAPIALVAALRETSILFATALSLMLLKERVSWARCLASALIATGAVCVRLA